MKFSREGFDSLAEPLGGERALFERLWSARPRLAIVTDGAAPVRYCTPEGKGEVAGFRVDAVDTTAAGDALMGGFLYWLAREPAPREVLGGSLEHVAQGVRFGAACGALAVTRRGAFTAMPAGEDVARLMRAEQ